MKILSELISDVLEKNYAITEGDEVIALRMLFDHVSEESLYEAINLLNDEHKTELGMSTDD